MSTDNFNPVDAGFPTEEERTDTLKKADIRRNGLTDEQIKLMRIKAKSDLFWLAYGVLGYNKLQVDPHGKLCKWRERYRYNRFKITLWPRGHYKTTIGTISDSIQTVLPDDLKKETYPYDLGPNVRILLSHEVAGIAQDFLKEIAGHVLKNELFATLFPELVPTYKHQRINSTELELPRQQHHKEATFSTVGVGAKYQGPHHDILKFDDIYGKDARDSPTERKGIISWVNNAQSLFVTQKTGFLDTSGTRWAHDDVYAHLMKVYGAQMIRYVEPVYRIQKDGSKKFLCEEIMTWESSEVLRQDPIVWNAQYMNDPNEGKSEFEDEWLRLFTFDASRRKLSVYNGFEEIVIDIRELDIIISVDPAKDGMTGYVITGTDSGSRYGIYTLKAKMASFTTVSLTEEIFRDVLIYKPRVVLIEDVLFSSVLVDYVTREMQHRGIRFNIEGVKTKNVEKNARIAGLSGYYQAGQIHHADDQYDIIQQFREFGRTNVTHLLDALAQCRAYWRSAVNQRVIAAREEGMKLLMAGRSNYTGYSSVYGDSDGAP